MIKVALLTIEQKDLLIGKEFNTDSYFNPIQLILMDKVFIPHQELHQPI